MININGSVDADSVALNDYKNKWLDYFHRCFKTRIQIEGLPDTIQESQLVDWLWYYGSALIFKPTKFSETPWIGFWSADKFNVYSLPYSAKPVVPNSAAFPGFDARSRIVDPLAGDAQEAVILFTNPALYYSNYNGAVAMSTQITLDSTAGSVTTPAQIMNSYAYEMALLDKLQEQNTILNSHPFVINASGVNEQNAQNLINQLKSIGMAMIQPKNGKIANPLTELQIIKLDGVTWQVEDIINAKKVLLDEAYNFLGVPHSSYEKAERLVTAETEVGQQQSTAYASAIKEELRHGFDQIEKVFKETWRIKENDNNIGNAQIARSSSEKRDQSDSSTEEPKTDGE